VTSADTKHTLPARVTFPEGEATIVALRCETCGDVFVPLEAGPKGPRVVAHLVVAAVDALCVRHHGHELTCYAVLDSGEEVTGTMTVHWPARKGALN
jgi:hypothetical protein